MPGTYVYIDGFNLYYGALKRTPYKWLDVSRLREVMLPNDHVASIQYFTARVSARAHNPSAPLDQQVYLRALRTFPNLSITFGHFLTHSAHLLRDASNWAGPSHRPAISSGMSMGFDSRCMPIPPTIGTASTVADYGIIPWCSKMNRAADLTSLAYCFANGFFARRTAS
jgi:hypothetical protein